MGRDEANTFVESQPRAAKLSIRISAPAAVK
jgi:hypothetical protein